MTITRIGANNNARFTIENYEKLDNHYKIKNQQIHIAGTYAELMHKDKAAADLLFLFYSDYLVFHNFSIVNLALLNNRPGQGG